MVRHFTTRAGLNVSVGENARENEEILHAASQKDLWFHLENQSSCHAILHFPESVQSTSKSKDVDGPVRSKKKKGVDAFSTDDIYDACQLVKHFTGKAKQSKSCTVIYTNVKSVTKKGATKLGEVVLTKKPESKLILTNDEIIAQLLST